MPNESHSRTNRDAFSADSESRQPPLRSGLFATMPIDLPDSLPKPTTMFGAHFGCSSRNSLRSGSSKGT